MSNTGWDAKAAMDAAWGPLRSPERDQLEDRILDVVREKNLNFASLQKAEKEAGVPSGTKPTVEQLQAVLAALEGM